MSYCLNPKCPNPSDLSNSHRDVCRHCGSELLVQGRYRVVRPLGGGGFGRTFEANDRGTLKVLKVLYKHHPKAVELFQQEASVLSRLIHPGIPKVDPDGYFTFLPANFKEPLHCLVMEKITGSNLEEWMKERDKKPLKQEEALNCLKQLVEILDKVHQQQFFHRDIKPLNIMRRPDGQFVLIDFGAAREVTGTYLAKVGQGQNVTGIVSPGYTPPEQINGKAVPQSDFYALGRTFVYLATGQPPTAFPENPRTGKLIWRDHAPQIEPDVADVIDYLMAPFPGNRPQNAQMILQCLAETDPTQGHSSGANSGFAFRRHSTGSGGLSGIPTSGQNSTGRQKTTGSKLRRSQSKRAKSKKDLLVAGSAALLLGLTGTQLYAYFRYGYFPANPIQVIASLPGSRLLQRSINGQAGSVSAIAVNPIPAPSKKGSGLSFASASFGTIRLWDQGTGKLLHTFVGHSSWVRSLAISSDGQILASGSDDKTVRLWSLDGLFRMLTIPAHTAAVRAVAISPDGQTLVSGSEDRTVRIWSLPTGQRLLTIAAHAGPVNALAISPDGQLLASASDDKTVKIWNLNTGRVRSTLSGHAGAVLSLAISPDGKTLASGSADSTIKLWDLKTGKLRKTLRGYAGWVRSLAISPDGKLLASGADSIKLWNLKTGSELGTFSGHGTHVTAVAISPDGQTLISGSPDQTLKIWALPKPEK
ncbi:MAG: serine/threonine protein kinase [Oscillatoria princeps RMCB-10]|nr:serine/threonine protein kinase [Oscillatoria princeps RMCB-10]